MSAGAWELFTVHLNRGAVKRATAEVKELKCRVGFGGAGRAFVGRRAVVDHLINSFAPGKAAGRVRALRAALDEAIESAEVEPRGQPFADGRWADVARLLRSRRVQGDLTIVIS